MIEAAVAASAASENQRVADVGFGGGIGLQLLLERVGPSGRVDGIDVSPTMVAQARRTYAAACAAGTLSAATGSMLDLPLPDDSLDAAITVNTVYFLDDVTPALKEFHRVLKPGGRLVIGIGDPAAMARAAVTAHGFHLRSVDDLLEVMTARGFVHARAERATDGRMTPHLLVGQV